MFSDMQYFLCGTAFGFITAFLGCFVACMAYSRMTGSPTPTGVVYSPQMADPLPFTLKDDRAEARIERELLGRDSIEGLGR